LNTPHRRTRETRRGQRGRVLTLLLSYCRCIYTSYIYREKRPWKRRETDETTIIGQFNACPLLPPTQKNTIFTRMLWGCYLHSDPINHLKIEIGSRFATCPSAKKGRALLHTRSTAPPLSAAAAPYTVHIYPARTYIIYHLHNLYLNN